MSRIEQAEYIGMAVVGLTIDPFSDTPIVLLKERVEGEELSTSNTCKMRPKDDEAGQGQPKTSVEKLISGMKGRPISPIPHPLPPGAERTAPPSPQGTEPKLPSLESLSALPAASFLREEPEGREEMTEKPTPSEPESEASRVVFSSPGRPGKAALVEGGRERFLLPIWVSEVEAHAIATELLGVRPPRPMTHALLKTMLSHLGAQVTDVLITSYRENVFYAQIKMHDASKKEYSFDARPADALALGVRFQSSIWVHRSVLEKAMHADESYTPSFELDAMPAEQWEENLVKLSSEALEKYNQ